MSHPKVNVAIVGASGYSGEELLRLLTRHPGVDITTITSRQYDGQPVSEVFPRFGGSGLKFSAPDVAAIAKTAQAAFLALPHGLAAEFAIPLMEAGVKIIDLSADFRLKSQAQYKKYYKEDHPSPALLAASVYGAPERKREAIRKADLIACPGCYPTSIVLPLAPLLKAGLVSAQGIVCSSMSGVSGAGRKVALEYIFPECNESCRPYGVSGHRHLPEIEQELAEQAGLAEVRINFIPHLVPVNRGIHSSIIADAAPGCTMEAVQACWKAAYGNEPFVRILPPGKLADTKNVTLTNTCEFGAVLDPHTGKIILSSAIDNLTKGAAGQAVQCFNIIFGFDEKMSLI